MNETNIAMFRQMMQMLSGCGLTEKEGGRPDGIPEEAGGKPAAVMEEPGMEMKYIRFPYSYKERELVMEWIYGHSSDVKALAVALWFDGGITPQEIINLRREDCRIGEAVNETEGSYKKTNQRWSREEIVRRALKLHPEDLEFVFMYQKGAAWKKLNGSSIQMKLYNICDAVGITYKSVRKNEAAAFDGN